MSVLLRRVLDLSNYSGVPSVAKLKQLMAAGWDAVILGTQFPVVTRQQYEACYNAGMPVEGLYCFVYWDGDDPRRINEALGLATPWNLKVWLDCEWDKTGYPGTGTWAPAPSTLVVLIHNYKTALGEHYAGIYTGRWWWVPFTGNNRDFANDPLWHAAYGAVDFEHFPEYGGWTAPQAVRRESDVDIWQYSSGGTDGVTADLNIERVVDEMPDPGHVMTAAELAQVLGLLALTNYIRNGWNRADLNDGDRAAIHAAAEGVPA